MYVGSNESHVQEHHARMFIIEVVEAEVAEKKIKESLATAESFPAAQPFYGDAFADRSRFSVLLMVSHDTNENQKSSN